MKEKKVFYSSTDNIKLCGLFNIVNNLKKIVILCHGLNGSKEERLSFSPLTNELAKNNINSFRFDFRAQGESTGTDYEMTISKEVEDLESTIKFLEDNGFNEFILLGASFGASIVSLLNFNKYKNINAVVLWYGALNYKNTTASFFSDENKKIADSIGYYSIESKRRGTSFKLGKELFEEVNIYKPYLELTKISIPKLFVHGTGDTMVQYEMSLDIHNKCTNSQLELIENGTHTFDDSEKSLKEAINKTILFIKKFY